MRDLFCFRSKNVRRRGQQRERMKWVDDLWSRGTWDESISHHGWASLKAGKLSVQCQFVPDRSFLDIASLGQSVPWTLCPWPNHPLICYDPACTCFIYAMLPKNFVLSKSIDTFGYSTIKSIQSTVINTFVSSIESQQMWNYVKVINLELLNQQEDLNNGFL